MARKVPFFRQAPFFLAVFLIFFSAVFADSGPSSSPGPAIGQAVQIAHEVKVRSPAGEERNLRAEGDPVYLGDEITTSRTGFLKIRLMDETIFTVGPKSVLVLDQFVYDPASGEGALQTRVKGFFRFVSGKIVKKTPENMTVKMAVGNIGVRGTQVAGESKTKESIVVLEKPEGAQTAEGHAVIRQEVGGQIFETALTEFGYGTKIERGKPPGPPFPVGAGFYKRLLENLAPPHPGAESREASPFAVYDKLKQGFGAFGRKPSPESRDATLGGTQPEKPPEKPSHDDRHYGYHSD